MDNPAFNDATAINRQARRFSRAASVAMDNEASPFSPTSPRCVCVKFFFILLNFLQ